MSTNGKVVGVVANLVTLEVDGPVSQNDVIDLFVNLRCMRITPEYLSLYVGGGITLDSDPSDEWDETGWKVESLLKILRTYLKKLAPAAASQPTYH